MEKRRVLCAFSFCSPPKERVSTRGLGQVRGAALRYRREIDGLRAVAVLPVVLFHAGFSAFSGGFVGVDIFFVISGYLITTIILEQQRAGRFSIAGFYERRARRILPALLLVILVSSPFAYVFMLPNQLSDFAASAVTLMLALSNIFFLSQVGYFSPDAELQPLLHTWSLSVEEQYYVAFPWIIVALARFGDRFLFRTIAVLTALSFVFAIWATSVDAERSFFFSLSRFWEIGVGSLCALWGNPKRSTYGNGLSIIGLMLVAGSVALLDAQVPFPGPYTLFPVVGAALIVVFATEGTLVSRLLSGKLVVGIGLISYSTYLWHQPLFAFAKLSAPMPVSPGQMLVLSVLAVVLGWLSWRFVETPFRRSHHPVLATRRAVFGTSFAMEGLVTAAGVGVYAKDGLPERSNGTVTFGQIEARLAPNYGLSKDCDGPFGAQVACATGAAPRVLIWGDSFAMHLVQGLLASDPTLSLRQATLSGCAPILGLAQVGSSKSAAWAQECITFNRAVLDWLGKTKGVDLVVLSSPLKEILTFQTVDEAGTINAPGNRLAVQDGLVKTADAIRATGASVLMVSPTPQSGENIGQCLVRATFFGGGAHSCDFTLNDATVQHDVLRAVEATLPVYWLDRDICSNGQCHPWQEGHFIYSDFGHLTQDGSAFLGETRNWAAAFKGQAR
jgi:peptidoglycan/LPS O-acetylase OafA/YrhL